MNGCGALKASITTLAILVLLATALPFARTDEWWVRIFDFPRLQIAFLGLFLVAVVVCWRRFGTRGRRWLAGLLLFAVAVQIWHLFPYTTLSRKQVLAADAPGPELTVLVANVYQENRQYDRFLRLAGATSSDIILVIEVDDRWTEALKVLTRTHPHTILQPQTNTYGMNLYSRFPLRQPEVRFLTDPGVPSIRAEVDVRGHTVRFYAVHPRPPGRSKSGSGPPLDSGQRDAELVLIAGEAGQAAGPVIVAGDFNDVAWSHTTRLFQRISRLLDPRVGRGLYNTHPASAPFLRFPLDHLFHSDHFQLVQLRRLDACGSDHIPILATLRLQELAPLQQEAPPNKPSDALEAAETIEEEMTKPE